MIIPCRLDTKLFILYILLPPPFQMPQGEEWRRGKAEH
jgi:hypothetical protein